MANVTDVPETTSTRVGPYRLEDQLGAGGMGQVYGAFDERLERRVALKQILPDSASDSRVRKRFLREARAAARLNHPAIVQIHDILEIDGCDWIVMELVDGDTLDDLIARGALPVDRVLALAIELAGGLEAAHGEGIVHRDLKAKNVLVNLQGRIKILDFGLAKPIETEERELSISIAGQVVGTPRAMSPEQAMAGEVDHRSDLFSLGTLLYEMTTGVSPFTGPGVIATVTRVCTHRQQPVCEVNPAVPAALSELIDRLLEKEPAHRPQTAREVMRELRDLSDTAEFPESVPAATGSGSDAATYDGAGESPATVERPRTTVERRQLTVMSCELIDADDSVLGLDPETLVQIVPELHALVSDAIVEFDGHLGSVLGHRLVVYFGYPRAHEDDARRAVRAALQILSEIDDLNDRADLERPARLALRIGIHTGLAVVMPGPSGDEQVALGQTLEVANRVESLAPSNTVVVSPATHPLIEGFFVEEAMAPVELPGFGSPVPVHRVVGAHDIHTRVELAEPRLPLIGRQQELDLLLSRWQLARGGTGQVVSLSGEAGIGKSRLVYTLERRLLEDGALWLMCYGSPYAQSSPLRPVIELLRRVLEIGGDPSRQLERLEHSLRSRGIGLADAVPLFAPLFGLELDDRYPPLPMSPEKQRSETMEAILALLMEMADRQPLGLVVEDLHWLDPSTLELLGLLIDQAPAAPLLLVLTSRNEFEAPWGHRSYLTQLNLMNLVGEELENLIDRVPGGKDLPADVRRQIVEKTDGVPLFVEELTKAVLESGLLDDVGAHGSSGTVPSLAIPATLRDSLTARLDHLGAAKEVAQFASVIGRGFRYDLLAAVSSLEETDLKRELERLVEAELVHRRGLGSRTRYVFKHALIQDAAYDSLVKGSRKKYHRQIAEALEKHFPETADTQPELLAHHYQEGLEAERAISFWLQAGRRGIERSANFEAVEHLRSGLGLIERLPNGRERVDRELSLLTTLGAALIAVRGFGSPEVGDVYLRAEKLAGQSGESSAELNWVLRGLYLFYLTRAEYDKAQELAARQIRLAEAQSDPIFLVAAHFAAGSPLYLTGQLDESLEHLRQATRADIEGRDAPLLLAGEDPGVAALSQSGVVSWLLGYPDQGLQYSLQALDLARQISHSFSEGSALTFVIWLRQFRREGQQIAELAPGLNDLCQRLGFYWSNLANVSWGWAQTLETADSAADVDRSDAGIELMHQSLAVFRAIGMKVSQTYSLGQLFEAHVRLGRHDEATSILQESLSEIRSTDERFWESEICRLAGDLALDSIADRSEAEKSAEERFQEALEIARRQSSKSLELRAALSLSRLWQRQGKREAAHELLSTVYDWFTEGFDTPDLLEAKALLDSLS